MKSSAKYWVRIYLCGLAFLLLTVFLGIALGSTRLYHSDTETALRILTYVRIPRTLSCIAAGSALAVSGAVIQGVLGNKLASPSIIGVNSGAGLAVTLCTAFGIYSGWRLSFFSFLGAFAAVLAVSAVARSFRTSSSTVILIGVALNSFFNAVSDTVITFAPEVGVMSNNFRIGEFSAVNYQKLVPALIMIFVTVAVLLSLSDRLDVISFGEETAMGLGLDVRAMRTLFLLLAALLAGCAVSLAGLLSFVGLIVPHAVRLLSGGRSARLLPLCALFGAGFVTLCDTLARTVFSPYEIPVGIFMAFLGVPFFLYLLIKGRSRI